MFLLLLFVRRWDHPRSRGEYLTYCWLRNVHAGSSPLSRGIPGLLLPHVPGRGIIPALAGNTASQHWPQTHAADHPRSRGEYRARSQSPFSGRGSSPLSRGIREFVSRPVEHPGIIPALAGNTLRCHEKAPSPRDHPRSRGEYPMKLLDRYCPGRIIPALAGNTAFQRVTAEIGSGSSPLSRGIRGPSPQEEHSLRIIPALAGNTTDRRVP